MSANSPQRVLITGASGMLGYNLVQQLGDGSQKTHVRVLLRTVTPGIFSHLPAVSLSQVDMLNTARLMDEVKDFQPDAIIHCAATGVRPSKMSYFDFVRLNVSATMDLFRASCDIPDCHFLHISTGLAYASQLDACREDDPVNTLHPYGASKAAADGLLRAGAESLKRSLTIVRPFSFTGLHDGGDRLFPSLLRCAVEGRTFAMSSGTQRRDFCAVEDVVDAVVLLLDNRASLENDTFNVGSGACVALGDLVRSVVEQLGLEVKVETGARPLHPLEPARLVAETARLRALGWQPRVNLAHSVWQLAKASYPELAVKEPRRSL